jgi:hypothetical protein
MAPQGQLANMVIDTADGAYHANLTPFTDQQFLATAGIEPGVAGPTYIDLSPFVLLPTPEPTTGLLAVIGAATAGLLAVFRGRRLDPAARPNYIACWP